MISLLLLMIEVALIAVGAWLLYDYLKDLCWWIKGPTNWFGIGNSIEVFTHINTFLDWLLLKEKYNGTFTYKIIGIPRFVYLNDVKNVTYLLKDNFDNFVKGKFFQNNFEDLLGDGIFSMDGDKWRMQRKAAAKIFHVHNFREHMIVVFNKHMNTVCNIAKTSKSFDFHAVMHQFTLDSFTEIGFGESVNSLHSKENKFATAFDGLQKMTNEKFLVPRVLIFLKNLFTNKMSLRAQYKKDIDSFSYQVIQRRLQLHSLDHEDLLSHFLRMQKENGETYLPQDLRNIVLNFIIAGRDTTAQALSWVVYELKDYPEIISKIRKEIKENVKDVSYPTYEEIKSLSYTHATFMEVLRLHPSVPKNVKYAVKACTFPDGTFVRAGWGVCWSPYAMARTKEIWGEDCCELKPERFLSENYDPNINFSFHAGPRTCLGQQMAQLEAVGTMAMLYSQFDIKVLNKATYNATITLQMKDPLMVQMTRIN